MLQRYHRSDEFRQGGLLHVISRFPQNGLAPSKTFGSGWMVGNPEVIQKR